MVGGDSPDGAHVNPAVYSEIDPHAAEWLRQLQRARHIAPGVVLGDIHGLAAADLVGRPVHLFAGIGGWPRAFRLAGIPDDAPVWSGSCPCQPFSVAGRGGGVDDVRHLWPVMRRLVAECLPPVVVGEQVASAAGRLWLDTVRLDLEALGYAVGAADLCAAGVGAPHIRQRLFWGAVRVADAGRFGLRSGGPRSTAGASGGVSSEAREQRVRADAGTSGAVMGGLADGPGVGRRRGREGCAPGRGAGPADGGGMVDTNDPRPQGRRIGGDGADERVARSPGVGWHDGGWVQCTDGRSRPTAPIARRVDDGVSARVGLLRGYGNAIVPEVAAQFLIALLDLKPVLRAA